MKELEKALWSVLYETPLIDFSTFFHNFANTQQLYMLYTL